ncbi:MAG: guanylate kinase, partial [Flavobacteriales bacterium]|nr:guanylate kinase [Flavobacteriales bacterium]
KAAYELAQAAKFDKILVNDNLEKAKEDAFNMVSEFLAI